MQYGVCFEFKTVNFYLLSINVQSNEVSNDRSWRLCLVHLLFSRVSQEFHTFTIYTFSLMALLRPPSCLCVCPLIICFVLIVRFS
jgi:hypothetical protein